jgi:hypothetical protein
VPNGYKSLYRNYTRFHILHWRILLEGVRMEMNSGISISTWLGGFTRAIYLFFIYIHLFLHPSIPAPFKSHLTAVYHSELCWFSIHFQNQNQTFCKENKPSFLCSAFQINERKPEENITFFYCTFRYINNFKYIRLHHTQIFTN